MARRILTVLMVSVLAFAFLAVFLFLFALTMIFGERHQSIIDEQRTTFGHIWHIFAVGFLRHDNRAGGCDKVGVVDRFAGNDDLRSCSSAPGLWTIALRKACFYLVIQGGRLPDDPTGAHNALAAKAAKLHLGSINGIGPAG